MFIHSQKVFSMFVGSVLLRRNLNIVSWWIGI